MIDAWLAKNDPEMTMVKVTTTKPKAQKSICSGTIQKEGVVKSRYIPKAVKREVYKRDHGQCRFVSTEGRRCGEKTKLQYDHVELFARGGSQNSDNLRLMCPVHNGLLAELVLGRDFVRMKKKECGVETW